MTDAEVRRALTEDQIVTLTLYGEARGEPIEGIVAVGCVIRNRVRRRRRSYRAICLQPWQFSCWRPEGGQSNHDRVMARASQVVAGHGFRDSAYAECALVAEGITRGTLRDRVRGADHYLTARLFETSPPRWARGQVPVATVGRHVFLRLE